MEAPVLGSCQGRVWRPVMSIFDDITVFQIASFSSCSPSTLESRVFEKHRFQIAPLSIAFSNCSVFGVVVWTTDVSGAKQLCFRFENGLVLTGSQTRFETEVQGNSEMAYLLEGCDSFTRYRQIPTPQSRYSKPPVCCPGRSDQTVTMRSDCTATADHYMVQG